MNAISSRKNSIIVDAARLVSFYASVCFYFAGRYFAYYYFGKPDCLIDRAVP